MHKLFADIEGILKDDSCLVGMGNYLKSDDAVGLYIVEAVKKMINGLIPVFNVEDVIEAYVFKIAELDCKNIIVVDAVKTDAEKGSIVFGKLEDEFETVTGGFSTHKLALKMSGNVFKDHGKETYLLGVVVENVDFGAELSGEIRESADALIKLIVDALKK